jgi:steroid delta-isomerase-like uncharacterized protein
MALGLTIPSALLPRATLLIESRVKTERVKAWKPRDTRFWPGGSGGGIYKFSHESDVLEEDTMAGQDNLHIAREIFAAWNAHDVEGFVKRLDTKTTWESDVFPAPFSGHEGARQFFKVYLTAFPDLHLDIQQMLAAGDSQVVVRWRSRGTHLGPLGDIPATGRKASNHGCTVMKGKNSKGCHAWVYFDNAHLLRQIGALPGS